MLRDWVRILGETAHNPWSASVSQYQDLPEDVVKALPAAMAVAMQPRGEDAIPQDVLLEAYRAVYRPGWSSRHFETAYEKWEEAQAASPDEGHRAVDLDSLDSPMSPRRRLRDFWISGAAQRVITTSAHDQLLTAI